MEFSRIEKKWWRTPVPEDEREKEWGQNTKKNEKTKEEKGESAKPKKEEDFLALVKETDQEAMRRRMMEANRLHAQRMSRAGKLVAAFLVICIIGIVLASICYMPKGELKSGDPSLS